jgi:hypothetical protein bfra3_11841|nr:MAG TPA: hypothetical protein [Caudoviricetes sp.]
MKTSFDIDRIVFDLLSKSQELKSTMKGGIYYQDDRPDDSADEDVVINTITLTQDYLPQLATSNVNIYVADQTRRIKGVEQVKPNHARLAKLTKIVLEVLRSAQVEGLKIIPESQTVLQEQGARQHFCNIRLAWNIQTI